MTKQLNMSCSVLATSKDASSSSFNKSSSSSSSQTKKTLKKLKINKTKTTNNTTTTTTMMTTSNENSLISDDFSSISKRQACKPAQLQLSSSPTVMATTPTSTSLSDLIAGTSNIKTPSENSHTSTYKKTTSSIKTLIDGPSSSGVGMTSVTAAAGIDSSSGGQGHFKSQPNASSLQPSRVSYYNLNINPSPLDQQRKLDDLDEFCTHHQSSTAATLTTTTTTTTSASKTLKKKTHAKHKSSSKLKKQLNKSLPLLSHGHKYRNSRSNNNSFISPSSSNSSLTSSLTSSVDSLSSAQAPSNVLANNNSPPTKSNHNLAPIAGSTSSSSIDSSSSLTESSVTNISNYSNHLIDNLNSNNDLLNTSYNVNTTSGGNKNNKMNRKSNTLVGGSNINYYDASTNCALRTNARRYTSVVNNPQTKDKEKENNGAVWRMRETAVLNKQEKIHNYYQQQLLQLEQQHKQQQQQLQNEHRLQACRRNLRLASLNLSTSSSTSSFSSLMSEQSQLPLNQSPLHQKKLKSVALSYYHHLYNQKLKSSATSNRWNSIQPALYRMTYGSEADHLDQLDSDNNYLASRVANNGKFLANKNFKNEFNKRYAHNSLTRLQSSATPTSMNTLSSPQGSSPLNGTTSNLTTTNNNSLASVGNQNGNSSINKNYGLRSFLRGNHFNYSTTTSESVSSTSIGTGDVIQHSLGNLMSVNKSAFNSDIKHVKFKNYGLHKSLGENLNTLTDVRTGVGQAPSASSRSKSSNSNRINAFAKQTRSTKSTNNLNRDTDEADVECVNLAGQNRLVHHYQQQQQQQYKNTHTGNNHLHQQQQLTGGYSKDFLNENVAYEGETADCYNHDGQYMMSNKRNTTLMPFKSCSPPRRRSQLDYNQANRSLVERALNNFSKFQKTKTSDLITFIPNTNAETMNEKSTTPSKYNVDFLNNSYETIFSTKTEFVNKPIQMSIDTKNSGGGMVTAEIKLNEQPVKFDLIKLDETKYELRLIPNKVGVYQIHMFLNGQSIKGSPFLIKIDSIGTNENSIWATSGSSNTQITTLSSSIGSNLHKNDFGPNGGSMEQLNDPDGHEKKKPPPTTATTGYNARRRSNDMNLISDVTSVTATTSSSQSTVQKKLRTELFDLTNQSDDLVVGEEVRLNVKILEYGTNDKLKKTLSNLETKVKHNDRPINHTLEMLPNGVYQIRFLPQKTGAYFVTFFKDGQKIDGSPYRLNIKGKYLKEISRPNFGQVGAPFIMDIEYCNTTNLSVSVSAVKKEPSTTSTSTSASSNSLTIKQMTNLTYEKIVESDNKLRVRFVPLDAVEHLIDINDNGVSIEGFPIKLNVFPNKEMFLLNENINGAKLGSIVKFKLLFNEFKENLNLRITNLDAGDSQHVTFLLNDQYQQVHHIFGALCKFLRISPNRLKNRELVLENGLTRVSFHLIDDNLDKQLTNSLLIDELRDIIETDKFTIIDLGIHKTVRAMKGSLKHGPFGENIAFKLDKPSSVASSLSSSGSSYEYVGEFKANSIGRYRIDVENAHTKILNSPYFVNVYDPSAYEFIKKPDNFILGAENLIEINLTKCGYANFEASIESPSGMKLPFKIDNNFIKKIRFIPTEVGIHKIYLKLGDSLLTESPLEISTFESKVPCVHGNGLYVGIQNVLSTFYVHVPSYIDGNLNIDILDPRNNTVKSYLKKLSDTLYEIKYLPMEIGLFKIVVNYNDKQIPSSPFLAQIINLDKVKMLGCDRDMFFSSLSSRILDLELEKEKTLCFDTTEAGFGDLNVDILAPNSEKLPFKKIINGNVYKISFTPVYEGQYKIFAWFNNQQLSYSPIIARTLDYSIFNEIKVYGKGIYSAELNQEAEFFVDCSKIKELEEECPEISFMGFSDDLNDLKINVKRVEESIYKCNYIPEKPGRYLINIKFNKTHISGSPFQINIGNHATPLVLTQPPVPPTPTQATAATSNESKIVINKEELKNGYLNQELVTVIDTREAGEAGELTATCVGPSKSARCEFVDQKDGTYLLKILSNELGKHMLQVKYNDQHVPGSPFALRISSPPDATKVDVFGPGICHGILENYESKFVCDTRGAGAGQLTVRIRGPKGAFKVDMQRKDEKDRSIICKYDPLESGEYQINVKWSGKHVPNSPFNVTIFKTKEELDAFYGKNPDEALKVKRIRQQQNNPPTTSTTTTTNKTINNVQSLPPPVPPTATSASSSSSSHHTELQSNPDLIARI